LNYQLQMLVPTGEWIDLYGGNEGDAILSTTHLASAPLIEKGQTYGFRYRSRNIYYWSEWSPVLTVLAADKPSIPPNPTFLSATANSISLQLYESEDYGGSVVTEYELWRDQGESNSEFSLVPTYDTTGFFLTHTMTFALDGITTGKIYKFRFRAKNSKGYSEFSGAVSIAAVGPPSKPATPSVDYKLSTRSQLYVKWSMNADGTSPGGLITGYKLYADDGIGGEFSLIQSTVGFTSQIAEYLYTGLEAGRNYRFKVVAYNFNPTPSPDSDASSFHACDLPGNWDRP